MRKRYLLVAAIQFLAGLVFYFLILGYRFTGALLMVLSVVTLVFGVLNTIKRTVFHIAFYAVLIGALVGSVVTGVFIGTHCGGSEDPEAVTVITGDLNGDGTVSSADAVLLARYLVDLTDLTEQQLLAADVNHDGSVSSADAVLLARFLVGVITEL